MTGLEHKPPLEWSAKFDFVHRTQAVQAKGHWRTRHNKVQRDREALAMAWMAAGRPRPPFWPAVVTFTRVATYRLDEGDNLSSAFKAMRDELAKRLGLKNDGGREVEWRYRQMSPKAAGVNVRGFYGVRVEIECEGRAMIP